MASPRPLHDRALDNLRYIRQTMERAGSFTAVPGWGQIAVGATALAAAVVAARQPTPELWLATWLGEAIVALAIGGRRRGWQTPTLGAPLPSGAGPRFSSPPPPPTGAGCPLTGGVCPAPPLYPTP